MHCGVQSQANNMRRVRGRPKTAYKGFFVGSISFEPCERIWKTWAPPKCRFFVWLVAHNRCWTADRLARRGLPHPEHCPLCDQAAETIDHLLVQCVFAREFWFRFFSRMGLQALSPQSTEISSLVVGESKQCC